MSRPTRWLAAIGSFLGVTWVLVLVAYGIRDYLRHADGGIPISGIVYSAALIAPFVASTLALMKGSRRTQVKVWWIAGVAASLLSPFSGGAVALPLVIPAGFLLAAAFAGAADR